MGVAASGILSPLSKRARTSSSSLARCTSVPSFPGMSMITSSPPIPFSDSRSQLCVLIKIWRLLLRCSRKNSAGSRVTISLCNEVSGSSRSSGASPSSSDQKSPIKRNVPSENRLPAVVRHSGANVHRLPRDEELQPHPSCQPGSSGWAQLLEERLQCAAVLIAWSFPGPLPHSRENYARTDPRECPVPEKLPGGVTTVE